MCLRVITAEDACPADHVKCVTSDECVSERYICDGQQDCDDGSDEPPECGMCRNVVVVVVVAAAAVVVVVVVGRKS